MNTFTITGVDPDDVETERQRLATVHGTRGEALTRGCEALVEGWVEVVVESPVAAWRLADDASDRPATRLR